MIPPALVPLFHFHVILPFQDLPPLDTSSPKNSELIWYREKLDYIRRQSAEGRTGGDTFIGCSLWVETRQLSAQRSMGMLRGAPAKSRGAVPTGNTPEEGL